MGIFNKKIITQKVYGENKNSIRFLLRAILIYFMWAIFYHYTVDIININDPLNRAVSNFSYKMLSIFQQNFALESSNGDYFLLYSNIKLVRVGDSCNGLELYVIFISFYLAQLNFYSNITRIFVGILLIFFSNSMRISLLAILSLHNSKYLNFHHKYTFVLFVYSVIIFIWIWPKRKS